MSHRDFPGMAIDKIYPSEFGGLEDVNEKFSRGEFFFGEGEYNELFFKGFHIGYGTFSLKNPVRIEGEIDYHCVKICFTFSGKVSATEIQSDLYTERIPNQYNIHYIKSFKGYLNWEANKYLKLLEISIIPEFFLKYLPTHDKRFNVFREKIERGETCVFSPYNYPITQAMQWIIRDIICSERNGIFKRIYLESKITELILLQMEQISESTKGVAANLNKGLIDKMMIVKEYIETHDLRSCTLSDLAKVAGTNEYTLKKSFKQVFGTTVFEYWNQLKMAEAKTLIMDGSFSVSEVAYRMGYQSAENFTIAFKRTFGYAPSKWKHKNGV